MKRILFILSLVPVLISCNNRHSAKSSADTTGVDRKWWKEAVVYQIYPRSFKDANGDGIGDLRGIVSKLDYIRSLGVDVVWLNPIYSSPNDDNGYDISDYRNIMKDFGSMEDFDTLLSEMHKRHIRLVMDLVVNHSSDEHPWFQQSRSSRANPYRNYYHWWDAGRGRPTPRWSFFDVNSDAWRYDSLTNAYYLHYFSRKQPDLNWENPSVRKEIYAIMKFWLDKGIDGFRMDAFQFVAKDTTWPVFPPGYERQVGKYYGMGPHLHDYLQEMNSEVLAGHDILTVAEGAGSTMQDAHNLVDPDRHELDMAYHFEGIDIGHGSPDYSLQEFKRVYSKWDSAFAEKGWLSIFLANHDQPRMVSHWGNDNPAFRAPSSKMLTTFLMTMRGTPYYYNGDEIGMKNIGFDKITDYRDIGTINKYKEAVARGSDPATFLESVKNTSRDNSRTPFQWDNTAQAGFTTGTPWIKVNPDYLTVNAAAQERDPNSILKYFRRAVQLRKENPVLVYGRYTLLDRDNPDVYAYSREGFGKRMLILLNFRMHSAAANTGLDLGHARLLLDNYPDQPAGDSLRPYEARVYELPAR